MTATATHTPGPWTVRHNPNGTLGIDAREPDGTPCQPAKINGDAEDEVYGPVTLANARLIAAAPELLEALEKAETLILYHGSVGTKLVPEFKKQIRAAIAKATAVVCLLLLATTTQAAPITFTFNGAGGSAPPPPMFNSFRVTTAADPDTLLFDWRVPDIQPSGEVDQSFVLDEANAASYGADWSAVEDAIVNPEGKLFHATAEVAENRPGWEWGRQTQPHSAEFTSVDEVRFDVDYYFHDRFHQSYFVWWRAVGEGRLVPEPGAWVMMLFGCFCVARLK